MLELGSLLKNLVTALERKLGDSYKGCNGKIEKVQTGLCDLLTSGEVR